MDWLERIGVVLFVIMMLLLVAFVAANLNERFGWV